MTEKLVVASYFPSQIIIHIMLQLLNFNVFALQFQKPAEVPERKMSFATKSRLKLKDDTPSMLPKAFIVNNSKILKNSKEAMEFLHEREQFWKQHKPPINRKYQIKPILD